MVIPPPGATLVRPAPAPLEPPMAVLERLVERLAADVGFLRGCVVERDAVIVERDAALGERDLLRAERDAALAEQRAALAERDALRAERDVLWKERGFLRAELDALRAERQLLQAELDARRQASAPPPGEASPVGAALTLEAEAAGAITAVRSLESLRGAPEGAVVLIEDRLVALALRRPSAGLEVLLVEQPACFRGGQGVPLVGDAAADAPDPGLPTPIVQPSGRLEGGGMAALVAFTAQVDLARDARTVLVVPTQPSLADAERLGSHLGVLLPEPWRAARRIDHLEAETLGSGRTRAIAVALHEGAVIARVVGTPAPWIGRSKAGLEAVRSAVRKEQATGAIPAGWSLRSAAGNRGHFVFAHIVDVLNDLVAANLVRGVGGADFEYDLVLSGAWRALPFVVESWENAWQAVAALGADLPRLGEVVIAPDGAAARGALGALLEGSP